jgi:diketogulonate reductase-like aldo/keto reductase
MGTYYDPPWILLATLFGIRRGKISKIDAIKAGLDLGMNFIDTAEIYRSEPLIARAIAGYKRDELFVASKVWSNHLREDALKKACKRSLLRLATSYLDLYQVHFANTRVPISETMRAMEQLVDGGLIRAIGVSNFSLSQMIEAESALKKHELASNQLHYNLAHRTVERDVLPHCEKENIALIAYFPLAHGKLSKEGGAITEIAYKHNATRSQVALSWLLRKSNVTFPIPRASKANHIREDARAPDLNLSNEDLSRLDSDYPPNG